MYNIYIYIYIYVCVSVCPCWVFMKIYEHSLKIHRVEGMMKRWVFHLEDIQEGNGWNMVNDKSV